MKIIKIVFISFVFLSFQSCIKTIDTPAPTSMQILVQDNLGYPLPGASVTLFGSESDFYNNVNPIATSYTDANGYLYFTNLSPIIYYYYVQYGCKDNFNGNTHLYEPLVPYSLNTYSPITLSSVGQIKVESNSFYPYQVLLDGVVVVNNLPSQSTATINEIPAGNHSLEVIQLSGYNGSPNYEFFNVVVTCGDRTIVTFP